MPKFRRCRTNAGPDMLPGRRAVLATGVVALLASCAQPELAPPQVAAAPPVAAAPVQPVPFPQAVLNAANGVFSTAPTGGQPRLVVIDPLVNGVTGDYSRGAAGFMIRDGALAEPVAELTIAGNLLEMFAHLTPANDLQFRRGTDAPTIRVEGMTMAGA